MALVTGFNIYFPVQCHPYVMKLGMELYLVLIVFIVATFEDKLGSTMLSLIDFTISSYLVTPYQAETETNPMSDLAPVYFKDIYIFAAFIACVSLLFRMINVKNR